MSVEKTRKEYQRPLLTRADLGFQAASTLPVEAQKTEPHQDIEMLGSLSDGRNVLRLQGDQPDEHGFIMVDAGATVIKIETMNTVDSVNEVLQTWHVEGNATSLPTLYAVIPAKDASLKSGQTDPQVQIAYPAGSKKRAQLQPFHDQSVVAGRSGQHTIPLENGISLVEDPETDMLFTIRDGEQTTNSQNYRAAPLLVMSPDNISQFVPGVSDWLSKITDKNWKRRYAKELWRRILQHGKPQEYKVSTYEMTGLDAQTSLVLSHDLAGLTEHVLARNPAIYWEQEYHDLLDDTGKSGGKNINSAPPHMNITGAAQLDQFIALNSVVRQQEQMYKLIARGRKSDGIISNDTYITSDEIREAEATATEQEMYAVKERLIQQATQESAEKTAALEKASNAISLTGVPHQWLGIPESELGELQTAPVQLPIQPVLEVHSPRQGYGMFTRALEKPVRANGEVHWGAEVHSPLTPDEVVKGMAWQVKLPIIRLDKPSPHISNAERARIVWNTLTSPQIEVKGSNIRTPEADEATIQKIERAIEDGRPIDFLIFGPWAVAPSILRGAGRTQPHLGHVDHLLRFSRINTTVEQVYNPGTGIPAVRFNWGNEADAFIDIGLLDGRIYEFEATMLRWLETLNPDKEVFRVEHMGQLLYGTPEKRTIFEQFKARYAARTRQMFDAYDNGTLDNPKHRSWVEEKRQLVYPIATIMDPYKYLPPDTPLHKIAVAYELIRANVFDRHQEFMAFLKQPLDAQTIKIGQILQNAARDIVIDHYVPIMDARYHTAEYIDVELQDQYSQIDPWGPLYEGKIHGRITDGGKNRWWVKLNSGPTVVHPTHGVAVVRAPREYKRPATISLRTFADVSTEPERYAPVYLAGDEDKPFHLIQLQ